jgi:hypothetical protein
MNNNKKSILKLIKPVFDIYHDEIAPAPIEKINELEKEFKIYGVPENVTTQILEFYSITNGTPRGIAPIEEHVLFEFWEDEKELWLGQVDMDCIKWYNNEFHLGSASDINYGDEYTAPDIYGILSIGFLDWFADNPELITRIKNVNP